MTQSIFIALINLLFYNFNINIVAIFEYRISAIDFSFGQTFIG